jgi:uncharacterized tellurite resistance protein B-like protein
MLVTDGKLLPEESEFLKRVCQRLELSERVLEDAFEKFAQGEAYVYLPEEDDEKKLLLGYLMEAVVADATVAPQERQLLEAVATRLGVSQDHFEDMLAILLKRTAS